MFNINDKVRLINYPTVKGTIIDILVSHQSGDVLYSVSHDEINCVEILSEGELELVVEKVSYEYEFEYLDNLVVAKLFETYGDDSPIRKELARGHGHIIHEGAKGIAQAASYALKKIYEKLNDGKI
jgi:hypothetical protein